MTKYAVPAWAPVGRFASPVAPARGYHAVVRPPALGAAILGLNPTVYWPENDAATPLADATGHGWTAAVTGSPTYGVVVPGAVGKAITWSGTGQYAISASAAVPTPTASISVVALIKTADASATQRAILCRGTGASQFSWEIQLVPTHQPKMVLYQAAGGTHCAATAASAANDGTWRLVAGTFDGTTAWVYHASPALFESASSGALTSTWLKATTSALTVSGRNTSAPVALFPGSSAHLALFTDRVLTAAEVRGLASAAFA